MTETTPRLHLPLLQAGQAQKEMIHNEALVLLDALTAGAVEAAGLDTPPTSPTPGQAWIVGASPGGVWSGQAGAIALWADGGWRFVAAVEGMAVRSRASGLRIERGASAWNTGEIVASTVTVGGQQVIGSRQSAIAGPSGGTTVDAEARTAVAAILVALRTHGLIAV